MKNNSLTKVFLITCVLLNFSFYAQDLLDKVNSEFPDNPVYEIATFKTTRIGLGQSVETRKKGALEFSFYNRYWDVPNLQSQNFLADRVSRRFGINYSFTDNFTFGIGYTDFDKISDAFFKYKIFKQQQNAKKMPVTITFNQSISHRNLESPTSLFGNLPSSNAYALASQLLVARKLNPKLSLQVSPTYIQRLATATNNDPNSQFAMVFGGRYKISGHASVVSEYYYVTNHLKSRTMFNSFMVGINWEVSDLFLQFHMTNARSFAEDTFITQTANNFNTKDGNFHFGFNVTYLLHTRNSKLK